VVKSNSVTCVPVDIPPNTPVTVIDAEPGSTILIDRCEDAEPKNCFYTGTWSRAPSLDAVAEGRSVLRFGHRGSSVEEVQRFLNQHLPEGGLLEVDGYFGPETEAKLQAFQKRQSIRVDGIVGQETSRAMADVVMRGLVVDQRFSSLPDEVQQSALNRLEETSSSQARRRLAEILISEGFAALPSDHQKLVLTSDGPEATMHMSRLMADARDSLQ